MAAAGALTWVALKQTEALSQADQATYSVFRERERASRMALLEEAVAGYRGALEERTRERDPLKRASTQNNLGYTLQILGERETGTARLEEAVAAYHASMEEYTRERYRLEWERTQEQLTNTLQVLSERRELNARERLGTR
jgi:16S rRNA G1207 methylase RsmC